MKTKLLIGAFLLAISSSSTVCADIVVKYHGLFDSDGEGIKKGSPLSEAVELQVKDLRCAALTHYQGETEKSRIKLTLSSSGKQKLEQHIAKEIGGSLALFIDGKQVMANWISRPAVFERGVPLGGKLHWSEAEKLVARLNSEPQSKVCPEWKTPEFMDKLKKEISKEAVIKRLRSGDCSRFRTASSGSEFWFIREMKKLCEAGDERSCVHLADTLEEIQEYSEAKERYLPLCDLGSDNACEAFEKINREQREAVNIENMYKRGKAEELYFPPCLDSDEVCKRWATVSMKQGVKLYQACEEKFDKGCYTLIRAKMLMGKKGDVEKLLRPLCEKGENRACIELGHFKRFLKQMEDSCHLYGKACNAGSTAGCEALGGLRKAHQENLLFEHACKEPESEICRGIKEKIGAGRNVRLGEEMEKACQHGIKQACDIISQFARDQ